MKKNSLFLLLLFAIIFPKGIIAQGESDIGFGVGYNSVWTSWYYDDGELYGYPQHHHRLFFVNFRYETATIIAMGPIDGEIALDVSIGIGNSEEDWLTQSPQKISSMAALAGINAEFKFLYPLEKLSPYVGVVFHFTSIYSNGGLAEDIWSRYTDGFGEFLGGGGFSIGVEFPINQFKIAPFYRTTWSGGFSNLDTPGSDDPESEESHTVESFGLMFLF